MSNAYEKLDLNKLTLPIEEVKEESSATKESVEEELAVISKRLIFQRFPVNLGRVADDNQAWIKPVVQIAAHGSAIITCLFQQGLQFTNPRF